MAGTKTSTDRTPADRQKVLRSLNLDPVAVAGGAVAMLLSLTPSLLPRQAGAQGALAGLVFGIGYAVTLGLWRLIRGLTGWQPSRKVRRWLQLAGWPLFGVVFASSAITGVSVQDDIRRMVELPPLEGVGLWAFVVSLAVVSGICLGVGWLLRGSWRLAIRALGNRGMPRRAAGKVAVLTSLVTTVVVLALFSTLAFIGLDRVYLASNGMPSPEVSAPASTHRSAGTDSEVRFDELGRQGANFIAGGPSAEKIEEITGQPALTPVRVYVGVAAGGTMEERAQVAVRELERTGGFEREVLVVATTTGTGWLEPQAVDAVEYLHSGNTAVVALQYAFTPSFVSSLTAPELPVQATTTLFDAVHERWLQIPEQERPKLVVYGLSLGSQGILNSFGTLDALLARTQGVLIVGPTNTTPLWRELQAARDPYSAPWRPVLDEGRHVRWASGFGDLDIPEGTWEQPHVVILQHATDPITWLGPELAYRWPEWLQGDNRAPDVSPRMRWIPVVTALQVALDMQMSVQVPARHGHEFGDVMLQGWMGVTGDGNLGASALDRVQAELETYSDIHPFHH